MTAMVGERPNILFILSDDQGAWALGCAGNTEIHTPRLDALAASGTRLENFFCASPVCSPARASLLTGAMPSRHGVHDYLDGQASGEGVIDFLAGQRTFPDELAENGYRVGLTGKWHLGASDRPRPGYSHWFALDGGGSDYHRAILHRDGALEVATGYLTDVLADDAIGFLEQTTGCAEPFFLALNFTAPHKPWTGQHPPAFERLYEDCAFTSCPQEAPHPWQAPRNGRPIAGEPDTRAALIGYFAAISAMDDAIGRVLGRLRELGLEENTLVVFSSDNGFSCGQHGFWGKGNGTLPQNMYDLTVKVPMIFSQPGRIETGRVMTDLLSAYDLAPTLLELAGLEPGEFERGPGTSFAHLLTSSAEEGRDRPVVVYDEYGPVRMLRSHAWKYVHRYPLGPHELFDLVGDPDEHVNEIDNPQHAERVREMRKQLHTWFAKFATWENDGSSLPVTGSGQRGLAAVDGLNSFNERGTS